MFLNSTESRTIPSAPDFEPDEQWKSRLKVEIENNLRSMVNEAKQNLLDTLKKAPVTAIERERLTEGHLATLKKIRNLAEEQFRIALERERQERRWAAGQTLDQEWSESMIKEQQAILDKVERERKKVVQSFSSSSQPTAGASGSRASGRPGGHPIWVSQEPTEARARFPSSGTRPHKPLSTYTTDRDIECSKPSPALDEGKDIPRFVRPATDTAKSIKPEKLQRKASPAPARQIPEFWVPSITTSSYRASPVPDYSIWLPSNHPARLPSQELEIKRKEEEARKVEEASKVEEARKVEEETKRKQDEIKRKEILARRKEEEVRRKEEEVRRKEEEDRRQAEVFRRQEDRLAKQLDEEARRVEQDILRKSEEAKHKEDEIKRKEEEEDSQRKEREVRRKSSQELSAVASGSLQDLTDQLQGRSNYPIASGGFGDIWKCDLVKLNEIVQVAVKTIRAFELDDDASMRKNSRRVRRELKVWGRLKHDCILPLWGVANDFGPYPAMICPWVDNGTLTGFLERRQDMLSSQDKFSLLKDIALGLQYLHNKSIVHGDLTGSNVLVGGNGRACLADFGLSTMILEFTGPSYLTSSIRGNIRWAAAELFEVPEDDEIEAAVSLSTECDIYSFGSIALQVLTCKVPYYNVKKDNVVLGQVIRGKKPEPPKESPIALLHWEFIQRCWLPRASRPSVGEIVEFVACEDKL